MSWLWTLSVFVCFAFSSSNELAEAKKRLSSPSVVVVGRVFCDTCFKQNLPKGISSHFIPGATVEVECKDETTPSSFPSFRRETKTDSKGRFKVDLPFSVGKHIRKIEGCSVKLVRSNEPFCSIAAKPSSLRLKSRTKGGVHVYSAGFLSFKPLNQPYVCDQKPTTFADQKDLSPVITNPGGGQLFPPTFQDPNSGVGNLPIIGRFLPPLPQLPTLPPLPQLPTLPSLPGIPFMPPPKKDGQQGVREGDEKVISTQQLPPTNIPNPFQPPPSPSLFPPNPFLPPPLAVVPSPPALGSPAIPGIFPAPAPPAGGFPISFPPFPFQPTPGFPGFPPVGKEGREKLAMNNNP